MDQLFPFLRANVKFIKKLWKREVSVIIDTNKRIEEKKSKKKLKWLKVGWKRRFYTI